MIHTPCGLEILDHRKAWVPRLLRSLLECSRAGLLLAASRWHHRLLERSQFTEFTGLEDDALCSYLAILLNVLIWIV